MISKKSYYYVYVLLVLLTTTFISLYVLETRGFFGPQHSYDTFDDGEFTEVLESAIDAREGDYVKHRNSFGFFDDEWEKDKGRTTYRIIAIGDSMTEGSYVRRNETWPSHLEVKLNEEIDDIDYEVMNMGRGGYNMYGKFEIFKNYTLDFNPDMIILQYYHNDWHSPKLSQEADEKFEAWKRGEYELSEEIKTKIEGFDEDTQEYVFAVGYTLHYVEKEKYSEEVVPEEEWDKYVEPYLLEMLNKTEEGIEFVVITWDSDDWQMEKLEDIGEEHEVSIYEFSNAVPLGAHEYRLPDGHLNNLGYNIIANETYKRIKDKVVE